MSLNKLFQSLCNVLLDSKEKVMLLSVVGIVLTALGVPESRQAWILASLTVVSTAVIVGRSYAEGKFNEGVVPSDSVDQVITLARALANDGVINSSHLNDAIGKYNQLKSAVPPVEAPVQPMPAPVTPPRPAMKAVIPVLFLAFVGCISGCASNPELSAYREGAWKVQAPLNAAHLQLMDDAVKAGIRSVDDKQVIVFGINEATALYNQSKATEAAGSLVPTTKPATP